MSDVDLTAEDFDDEDDGDWRDYDDPDYERDPDPEDHEIARDYEEYAEHCETVHGGGECDCRPPLAVMAWQLARGIANWVASPWRRRRSGGYSDDPPF